MVVTVCRVDNHPSRFLSPAYSILHSYVHKFKNHTCQCSYHFFIYIIRNHNVHLHKSYATTFPNVVHVLLFLTIVIILLPTYPTCHYLHQSIKQTTYCIQVFRLVQGILKRELQMRQCTFNTKIF